MSSKKDLKNQAGEQPAPIPAEDYTLEYYETCCQGFEEFKSSGGERLPMRLAMPLELAEIKAGMQVVDIGCGRGELMLHCARRGAPTWGLDYARPALGLAQQALKAVFASQPASGASWALQQANASGALPFASGSVDVVFMLDVVEHLLPHELKAALDETWRILRPGGRLVVHTMPSLWYYHYGYPIYRLLQRLRGQALPADPRARWKYSHVHVNEQTPTRLRRALLESGFRARVWLHPIQSYAYEDSRLVRAGMWALTHLYPFRWVFCNDIFAIGTKGSPRDR